MFHHFYCKVGKTTCTVFSCILGHTEEGTGCTHAGLEGETRAINCRSSRVLDKSVNLLFKTLGVDYIFLDFFKIDLSHPPPVINY